MRDEIDLLLVIVESVHTQLTFQVPFDVMVCKKKRADMLMDEESVQSVFDNNVTLTLHNRFA